MNPKRIKELLSTYRDGLLDDTLPFWIEHAADHQYGGIMASLNRDGTIIDTDKGVWQQGRFTWLLGELYNNVEQRQEWLDLAIAGAKFIESHCIDKADGRMWFHVTREGRPIRKRRYAFSESFAAIAFGELYRATGDSHFAEKAKQAFDSFLSHNLNPQDTPAKYAGTRPMRGLGFPMITIVTAQELRDSMHLESSDNWIERSIHSIREHHLKPDLQCVMETVGSKGEFIDHFDGRTLNPGHAIEGAWFIMHEGRVRGDRELVDMGCQMLDWSWERGWDDDYGGILYFVDVHGLPVQEYWHDMKFWWPQSEAIIATLMAYRLTKDPKYAEWHGMIHDWTYKHFPDPEYGEWFGYLHRDARISSPLKGNLWKGPFHVPRMQLICWKLMQEIDEMETK